MGEMVRDRVRPAAFREHAVIAEPEMATESWNLDALLVRSRCAKVRESSHCDCGSAFNKHVVRDDDLHQSHVRPGGRRCTGLEHFAYGLRRASPRKLIKRQ